MKKALTILTVLVFCLFFSVSVFAENLKIAEFRAPDLMDLISLNVGFGTTTAKENFKRVGEKELFNYEAQLTGLKADIEVYLDSLTAPSEPDHILLNAIIEGKDMKKLAQLIKEFDQSKAMADKDMEFYGLKTETTVPAEIRKIRDIYYRTDKSNSSLSLLNFSDNEKQEIRRFFTEKAGIPVSIEMSPDYKIRLGFGFLCGILAAVIGFVIWLLKSSGFKNEANVMCLWMAIPFITVVLIVLFVL